MLLWGTYHPISKGFHSFSLFLWPPVPFGLGFSTRCFLFLQYRLGLVLPKVWTKNTNQVSDVIKQTILSITITEHNPGTSQRGHSTRTPDPKITQSLENPQNVCLKLTHETCWRKQPMTTSCTCYVTRSFSICCFPPFSRITTTPQKLQYRYRQLKLSPSYGSL